MSQRGELLQKVQQYDFMLYELQLYLNSHPWCKSALETYKKYKKMSDDAKKQYTEKFGALRAEDTNTESSWNWIDSPWPWEREAN